MKKPITIGVIAVLATILVSSAVDYSAIGAKPIDQFHLETSRSTNEGIFFCPNGDSIEFPNGSLSFTEHDDPGDRGRLHQGDNTSKEFGATLWNGNVQSNQFSFTGIGNPSQDLAQFCSEVWPEHRSIITVWGECGEDVAVHFESESGYSGSFTGNVLCL